MNILLDFTGGSFSFIQLYLDSYNENKSFIGEDSFNIAKFGLSVISVCFDIIFIFQHYVIYKKPKN